MLDAIAQRAAQVCGSDDAVIRLVEGDEMVQVAHFGTIPSSWRDAENARLRARLATTRVLQRRTIHIADLQAEADRYPDSAHVGQRHPNVFGDAALARGNAPSA